MPPEKPEQNKNKRKCKLPGCNKLLSVYNLNDYCFTHIYKAFKIEYNKEAEKRHIDYRRAKKEAELKRKGKDETK